MLAHHPNRRFAHLPSQPTDAKTTFTPLMYKWIGTFYNWHWMRVTRWVYFWCYFAWTIMYGTTLTYMVLTVVIQRLVTLNLYLVIAVL